MKYQIKKEFFPFNKFTPPVGRFFAWLSQRVMKVPHYFKKDKDLNIEIKKIKGYKDEEFELYILSPKDLEDNAPALIYIHGGGFIFEASSNNYKVAKRYAKECKCKVFYVKYNLAPKYPFPYQQYESYAAYKYVFEHSKELGVDINKVGVTGGSAGATLCVTSMLLANEDKKSYKPLFQLLIYPWLDKRRDSESNKKYTDTPMWNSKLSMKTGRYTNPNKIEFPSYINSPVEYEDLSFIPPLYLELAEFDCLRDDGLLYASILKKHNIPVELNDIKGTMHGYDTKYKAKTTQENIVKRIDYINKMFENYR